MFSARRTALTNFAMLSPPLDPAGDLTQPQTELRWRERCGDLRTGVRDRDFEPVCGRDELHELLGQVQRDGRAGAGMRSPPERNECLLPGHRRPPGGPELVRIGPVA